MYTLITVLIVLASIALVLVVIVQNSKGGGLASGFASSNNIMGVRRTTDFVEKMTWWLIGILAVLCLVSTAMLPKHTDATLDGVEQAIEKKATTPVQAAPNLGGNAPTAPVATPSAPATPAQPAPAPAQAPATN